ncbi:DMT family transporter [Pseudorhodobacter sp. E13]|uniref:DMT family transporter n=1 Tax=Pseudorhodobacter sp. E13 TaxID=2487931 RepID=UPI000F8EC4C2|nr:DMT family transporter [Pseudorhodobacter sp. E13]RUS61041.1 DMT family transporter [Pseudorhodobacter sp. E13]
MTVQNTRLGIWLMVATVFVFAVQDGFSRYLAGGYSVFMVVMIRYWVFAVFVTAQALTKPGGLRQTVRTRHPWLQIARSVLLIAEICVMVYAYVRIGLINTHAIFAVCPLLVAGLAVPVLGEKVGWRRWTAIIFGMVGVAIILQPDGGVFSLDSLLPLIGAFLFALYSLLTRLATRDEPAFISFFWSGVIGCVLMTVIGLPHLTAMPPFDMLMIVTYSSLAILGHYLLIRSYSMAEASALQPFAYLQIVFVTVIAMLVFDETLRANVIIGGAIVILAGLFTVIRSRQKNQGKALRVSQR